MNDCILVNRSAFYLIIVENASQKDLHASGGVLPGKPVIPSARHIEDSGFVTAFQAFIDDKKANIPESAGDQYFH